MGDKKILRGLNATLADAHDNIVASVGAFTLLSLSVGGDSLTEDQMLNELFPTDLEVTVHGACQLDLRFKSTFDVSLCFTPYKELFEKTLKVPPRASVVLTLADDNAHPMTVKDLVERLVMELPGADKYRAAMARSKLVAITWEGRRYAVDSSLYLVSGLLRPLPPRSNWDANGLGIAVSVSMEIQWCKVDLPSSPFQKFGGGWFPSWCDTQMEFTSGKLVWRSKSGKQKKEQVTLTGTPSIVVESSERDGSFAWTAPALCRPSRNDSALTLKQVTIVKGSSGETRRLRGTVTNVDALVTALQNQLALTDAIPQKQAPTR